MKKSAWLPAVVVAGAIAAPAIANAANTPIAGSDPSAADVIASVAQSKDAAFSGKLSQSSDLGLPELSTGSSGSSISADASGVLDLLTSSHTARVYVDGTDRARVQVVQQLAEQDLVVNGSDVWTWDSKERTATHVTLPDHAKQSRPSGTATPADIAERAIDAITPTTTVSKPTSTRVAGHDAWRITMTPKDSDTLVGSVRIDVDKQTGLPLRAQVLATGQKAAAFDVHFTSLDYGTPAARLFDFTPPKGADVQTKELSDVGEHGATGHDGAGGRLQAGDDPLSGATTTGDGWGTIVALPAGTADLSQAGDDATGFLDQLTRKVDGGRALQTSLVSVYLTDDGRVLAGAVPVSALVAAAR